MPMMITDVAAPTRGPDYTPPFVGGGTQKVTAPAAVPAVATDPSSAALPFGDDTTLAVERRKKLLRAVDRAPPQRSLMAMRSAMPPLLQDIPRGGVTPRLAAQAYLAQRRAESVPTVATTTTIVEQPITAAHTRHHPVHQPTAAGGLDVTA